MLATYELAKYCNPSRIYLTGMNLYAHTNPKKQPRRVMGVDRARHIPAWNSILEEFSDLVTVDPIFLNILKNS